MLYDDGMKFSIEGKPTCLPCWIVRNEPGSRNCAKDDLAESIAKGICGGVTKLILRFGPVIIMAFVVGIYLGYQIWKSKNS